MTQYRLGIIVALLPVGLLLGTAVMIALVGVVRPRTNVSLYRWIAVEGLLGAIVASLINLAAMWSKPDFVGLDTFAGGLVDDRFAVFIAVTASALSLLVTLGATGSRREMHGRVAAFHSLLLVATAAVSLAASTREMAMLLAAASLLTVSLVGIAAMSKSDRRSVEAALKQLVITGVALGLLAEGLAVIYGATGATDLLRARGTYAHGQGLEGLGLGLCLLGAAGLVGAAPLHRWVLDAAAALPAAAGAAVVGLGSFGGMVILTRLTVSGFGPGLRPWMQLGTVLAALATLYPALLALRALDVRRLIGLLISLQGGLLLVAVLGVAQGGDGRSSGGVTALLTAAVIFAVASIASIFSAGAVSSSGIAGDLGSLRGLARRSPAEAIALTLGIVALAGLPPLGGLVARILIAASTLASGFAWVAIVSLVASMIAAIAVLRFLAAIYIEDNEEPAVAHGSPRMTRVIIATCAGLGLMATVLAQPLVLIAQGAALALH